MVLFSVCLTKCLTILFKVILVETQENISDSSTVFSQGNDGTQKSGFGPITKVQRTVTKTINSESSFETSPTTTKVKLVSPGRRDLKAGKSSSDQGVGVESTKVVPVSVVVKEKKEKDS